MRYVSFNLIDCKRTTPALYLYIYLHLSLEIDLYISEILYIVILLNKNLDNFSFVKKNKNEKDGFSGISGHFC